jgi:TIR domain
MNVFISHSRQNGSAALKLYERLSQRGVQAWLDTRELDAGEDWNQRVAAAIEAAGAFVVLVGPGAEPDRSQRFEWQQITDHEFYLDAKKPMIPVVIGSTEIPGFLRTRNALTVDPSSIDFDSLAERIAEALGKPDATIDPVKLKLGRDAREQAVKSLEEYSLELEREDVKRAGLRGLK